MVSLNEGWFCLLTVLLWGGQILRANGPDRETPVAVVVVRGHAARIEAEEAHGARVVRVARTGPVAAVAANEADARVVVVPSSREENGAVGIAGLITCNTISMHTVQSCPSPGAVIA